MLKACLFDLDGTLIDSERYYQEGTNRWIKELGIKVNEDDVFGIIGKDEKGTYEYLSKITGLSYEECKRHNEDDFLHIYPLEFKKYLFLDVDETFKELKKRGIKIAICSMSPRDYIERFVDECNLKEYVDYFISGCDLQNNKPDPAIYLTALDALKINASEAICIEDATSGIISGKRAGLKVVARDDSRFKIDQKDADYILEDLRKLSKIIDEDIL